jgi:alanine dehydrogenase
MRVAVLRETYEGERRVALVPAAVPSLTKLGLEVIVQAGAGAAAGFTDAAYEKAGCKIVPQRGDAASAECLVQVRTLGANPEKGKADLPLMRSGQVLIGLCDPLSNPQAAGELAQLGVTMFALELMPRITRAQSMDVLSSMATFGRDGASQNVPLAHNRGGHAHAREGLRSGRWGGRTAGDCDGTAAGRSGFSLRCAIRGKGTDPKPWREVRRDAD